MGVFADLVTEVMAVTGRPDLVTQTNSAVRSATLSAHTFDYFPKDLFETAIQWQVPDYVQSLDYKLLVPRWRAFKYLRKYDATALDTRTAAGDFLDLIQPDVVLDSYDLARENVCYLAGDRLEIRSTTKDTYSLLGCYIYPTVTEVNYSSWIAQEFPYAIIYTAASILYNQTGYTEEVRNMQGLAAIQFQLLQQQITAKGE